MKQVCGLFQNENGQWDVVVENGKIKTENIYQSYLKHNFLCFGRADANIVPQASRRKGTVLSTLDKREYFSQAWIYYIEGLSNLDTLAKIIQEINKACQRDKKLGLIDKNISVKSITRLDKTRLLFAFTIDEQEQDNIIIDL